MKSPPKSVLELTPPSRQSNLFTPPSPLLNAPFVSAAAACHFPKKDSDSFLFPYLEHKSLEAVSQFTADTSFSLLRSPKVCNCAVRGSVLSWLPAKLLLLSLLLLLLALQKFALLTVVQPEAP